MGHIIEVQGLKKAYGNVEAVKGIDFYMEEGSLFSFLGPNGAGKSTTIDIITTFLKPDEGEIKIASHRLGKEDEAIRNCIGAVFQSSLLDEQLSVYENLITRSSLYGMHKAERNQAVNKVMNLCELHPIGKQKYGTLSGGQRRRCDIARALLHSPKILFLDEPTTGLDPQTRKMIWNVIAKLRKEEGMSVFLTTHYMEEAAQSDYVVVIDDGEISAKGTPQELKVKYAFDRLMLYSDDLDAVERIVQKMEKGYTRMRDHLCIPLEKTLDAIPLLTSCADRIHDFEVIHGTMDDAFLAIIGKELQ